MPVAPQLDPACVRCHGTTHLLYCPSCWTALRRWLDQGEDELDSYHRVVAAQEAVCVHGVGRELCRLC